MSTTPRWISDISLRHRLKEAILTMCSADSLENRLKISKSLIIPLKIEDFPQEHWQQARNVLHNSLYRFIDDVNIEITAKEEEIDEYAKSLFELYNALLSDLSKYDPDSFQIATTPEYKLKEAEK